MTVRDDREWHEACRKEALEGTCSRCGGYGQESLVGRSEITCSKCNGTGKVAPGHGRRIKRVIIEYDD